jgi:hypothetical protein
MLSFATCNSSFNRFLPISWTAVEFTRRDMQMQLPDYKTQQLHTFRYRAILKMALQRKCGYSNIHLFFIRSITLFSPHLIQLFSIRYSGVDSSNNAKYSSFKDKPSITEKA